MRSFVVLLLMWLAASVADVTAEEKANGPSVSRNEDKDDAFVNSRVERKASLPAPRAVNRPETLPLSNRQNRRNPESCSRHTDLNAPQGIFGTTTSKYYPNERCSWKIELPRYQRVRLHFLRFDLESATHFRYDWVKVYDGSNVYAPLVGSFRGSTVPGDIISTSNTMYVDFKSDGSIQKSGFKIRYSVVTCSKPKELTASGGDFGTNGPTYGNYETCSWKIEVSDNKRLRLHFTSFNLESHPQCRYDAVKVYDGSNTRATLLGTFCGDSVPADIMSKENNLFVTFTSDGSVTRSGFRITYSTAGCYIDCSRGFCNCEGDCCDCHCTHAGRPKCKANCSSWHKCWTDCRRGHCTDTGSKVSCHCSLRGRPRC